MPGLEGWRLTWLLRTVHLPPVFPLRLYASHSYITVPLALHKTPSAPYPGTLTNFTLQAKK